MILKRHRPPSAEESDFEIAAPASEASKKTCLGPLGPSSTGTAGPQDATEVDPQTQERLPAILVEASEPPLAAKDEIGMIEVTDRKVARSVTMREKQVSFLQSQGLLTNHHATALRENADFMESACLNVLEARELVDVGSAAQQAEQEQDLDRMNAGKNVAATTSSTAAPSIGFISQHEAGTSRETFSMNNLKKPKGVGSFAKQRKFQAKDLVAINKPIDVRLDAPDFRPERNYDGEETVADWVKERHQEPTNKIRWINQLDHATSGILLVGLTKQTAAAVGDEFTQRKARKFYDVLVEGWMEETEYDVHLSIRDKAPISPPDVSLQLTRTTGADGLATAKISSASDAIQSGEKSPGVVASPVDLCHKENDGKKATEDERGLVEEKERPAVGAAPAKSSTLFATREVFVQDGDFVKTGTGALLDLARFSMSPHEDGKSNGLAEHAMRQHKSLNSNSSPVDVETVAGGTRKSQAKAESAHTHFSVVRRGYYRRPLVAAEGTVSGSDCSKKVTLLRVRLFTGRRHQIRVHLAFLGHPILGDAAYSAVSGNRNGGRSSSCSRSSSCTMAGPEGPGPLSTTQNGVEQANKQQLLHSPRDGHVWRMFLHAARLELPSFGICFEAESGFEKYVIDEQEKSKGR
ncbi:unnamed protein product [Amoebophrya sp. A120]|nr:unnamed protein product [Amoebophrya sp. A120]|eukprot:GSA120T00012475001.1